ncbi:MAG: HEPN domain-containing protein [Elusimicrobiota bacterium]
MSGLVKEWIKKAEEDYEAACALARKRGKATPDVVCFCAQQCAEKYFKAYLVFKRLKVPKTHDLMELLTIVACNDSSFELIHDLLERLNSYAVEFRYPGEDATKGEARAAVKAITEVRHFFRSKSIH